MKRFFTASAAGALALSLLTAPLAMAQQAPAPMDHSDQHGPQATQHMAPNAPQHPAMQDNHMQPNTMQHAQAPQRPQVQQHAAMQPSHNWRHGDRYTGDRRVVSDWNRYHASPPPRGYEWVQDGNELVLISITSGIIASVLANAVYQ